MPLFASRHVVGEIKHCGNLNEFLLKRLLYRHSNMGDSSDSDAEEDSKLREALDSEASVILRAVAKDNATPVSVNPI